MSIVGEIALSVLLERLVETIIFIRPKLRDYQKEAAKEIKSWDTTLKDLRLVLRDAEAKRSSNAPLGIENWLDELEDIAFDVEDQLEEFEYDIRQQSQSQSQSQQQRRRHYLPTIFRNFESQHKVAVELRNLTSRLNDIVARKTGLNLLSGAPIVPIQSSVRLPDGPVPSEPTLYGREAEQKKIIEFLRGPRKTMVDVLAIVGAGGIGKTTLVQHIYKNDEVIRSFPVRSWVCISQDFDLPKIYKCIIETVTGGSCHLEAVESIQSKVLEVLEGKKFFIVLDDLWNLDTSAWQKLCAPFLTGARGSKVLVTTRNASIANLVTTVTSNITLSTLCEEDWLELFWRHVGFDEQTNSNKRLAGVAAEISKKYGGLPLAAVIMGSLLRGKDNEEDWRAIVNFESPMAQDGQSQINCVLRMSYNDLPYYLKRCFLYCTIFPEDYLFREDDLVPLWIAAGLIMCGNQSELMKCGHHYFMDLVARSLFTQNDNHYVMHDLIRDMGRKVSYNKCGRWETKLGSFEKIRHLGSSKSLITPLALGEGESNSIPLRSLIILGEHYKIVNLGEKSFSKFTKLRVLYAPDLPILKFPKSICQMKHLKYLNLRRCEGLTKLPAEIGKLGSLEHLYLSGCNGLTNLPIEIGKLGSLVHLDLSGCRGLIELPTGMEKLSSLMHLDLGGCRGLTKFPVEMGKLENLIQLNLGWCEGLTKLPAEMGKLGSLKHLNLSGCVCLTKLPPEMGKLGSVMHLDLSWCKGLTELPIEIGKLSSLVYLDLSCCKGLTKLPTQMGKLSSLKHLYLSGCKSLIKLPIEMGKLKSLEFLYLSRCKGLTELPTEMGRLGSLVHLDLSRCSGLTKLPTEMGKLNDLVHLDLGGCRGLIELPTEMGKLGNLVHLDLCWCDGLIKLPIEMGKLGSLKYLNLSGCVCLAELPPEIGNLGSMMHLGLSWCEGLTKLPAEIGKLSSLVHLDLSCCKGLTKLPVEMGKLGSLKYLDLRGCVGLTKLPHKMGKLGSNVHMEDGEMSTRIMNNLLNIET